MPVADGYLIGQVTSVDAAGASPSETPVANYNAFQAALNAARDSGGGIVELTRPGVYDISNTLIVYSNTLIRLGSGVTVRNSARNTAYRPMLVNNNYSVAGTTVSITSSGTTCTVTWANHGRAVGDWIAIAGATAETGYVGVFEVATAPTANTLTYIAAEVPSTSPATGTVLAWPADVNISLEGGTWDYNSAALSGADSLNKMGTIFVHVRNLSISQASFNNVNKYAIFPINVRDFSAQTLRFDTLSDGIHMVGCMGADIQDIAGFFGDDIIAFLSNEGTLPYSLGTWQTFPHRMIEARNLRSYNSLQSGIKITGGTHPYRSITIDGLYGQFANAPITVFEDSAFSLLGPDIDLLCLRNIRPDSWGSTLGAVRFTVSADSCLIRRLEVDGISGTVAGTQKLIDVRSSGAGVVTIDTLVAKNVDYTANAPSGAAGFLAVGTNGVINQLVVDGFRMAGASVNNFFIAVDGTITRIMLSNGYTHSGNGFLVRINAAAGTSDVYLNNIDSRTTNNPVDFRRACNLQAVNWTHSGSTPVNINGTGTYILRGGVVSASTHIGIAGGASVQLYGFEWRHAVITTALAATTGQYCTSTESTPAAEAGPAVLTPVGWVALGTGAAGVNTIIT